MAYPVTPDVPVNGAAPVDGQKASYSASIVGLAPASGATDLFTITGSASKTIRITYVEVSGLATTAGTVDAVGLVRSTANSGGTSTNPAAIPHDANDAAATATINAYTANPTPGTLVGKVRAQRLFLNVAATGASDHVAWEFGKRPARGIVLRGTSQVFAVNLNAGTMPAGAALNVSVEWTEE
jgi:hypothetical protein